MMTPDRGCLADALASRTGWALERVLFALAGSVTLLGAAVAAVVSPWFLLLVAFVAVNQWLLVALGDCPMSLILTRAFYLQPGAPR